MKITSTSRRVKKKTSNGVEGELEGQEAGKRKMTKKEKKGQYLDCRGRKIGRSWERKGVNTSNKKSG